MKQNYFTIEGQSYVLKSATRNLPYVSAGITVVPEIVVNAPQSAIISGSPNQLFLNTPRAILPVMMMYSIADSPTTAVCDIASPYWFDAYGLGNFAFLSGLSKILPNIERIEETSRLFYRYGVKYNQIVLSEKDFINPQNSNVFRFMPHQYWAITRQGTNYITIPAGNVSITQTLIYFELEK